MCAQSAGNYIGENGHGPSSDILDNRVGNNGRLTFAICAQLLWTKFASLLLRSAKVLILRIDSRSIPFVSRNTMPPKQPTVEPTSGFVAKREDFPSLSPSPGGSSSGVARDRTARLEDITADLARGQTALFEGQHQLSLQIGEIVQGLRATTPVSSGGPSVPAQAPIGTQVPTSGEQLSQHPPFSAAAQQTHFVDFRRYADVIAPGFESAQPPPSAPLRPHLFAIENDLTFRQLSISKFKGALEEYQLLVSNGFFLSCIVAAQSEIVNALRADGLENHAQQVEAALNSSYAIEQSIRQRLHYIRLAKGQNKLSLADQLFAEHLRSAFQPAPFHLGCADTAALYEQFRAKEIECSLAAAAKAAAGKKYSASSSATSSSEGHKTKSKDKSKAKSGYKDKAKDPEFEA